MIAYNFRFTNEAEFENEILEGYEPYIKNLTLSVSGNSKREIIKKVSKFCLNMIHNQNIYNVKSYYSDNYYLNIEIVSYGQNCNESTVIEKNIIYNLIREPQILKNMI
jgi:hypothetical protein